MLLAGAEEDFFGRFRIALAEMGHGFDAGQFDQVGRRERLPGPASASLAGDFQGLVGPLHGQKGICQPEARLEIVRLELENATEYQRRLSEQALGRENFSESETNSRIVNRSVHRQECVPRSVPSDPLLERLFQHRRPRVPGLERTIEVQVDLGGDVSRVQPVRQAKGIRGIVQASQFFQLDTPPVERSRIPAPNHQGIGDPPADQGRESIESGPRVGPKLLILVQDPVGERGRRDGVGGIKGQLVNDAVGLQIQRLKIITETGVKIIDVVAPGQLAQFIHQITRVKNCHRRVGLRLRRPSSRETLVQRLLVSGGGQQTCIRQNRFLSRAGLLDAMLRQG